MERIPLSRSLRHVLSMLGVACLVVLPVGVAGAAQTTAAPANTGLPIVSGTAKAGATLSATAGTWTGDLPITFAYHWERCDAGGLGCSAIASAASPTLTLSAADVGHRLRMMVTAANAGGIGAAISAATGVVFSVPAAPVNTVAPTITGSTIMGQTLSASTGTWTGDLPIGFSYRWKRCDSSGTGCEVIAAATAATYTLGSADVGHRISVLVDAGNDAGHAAATSAATAVVTAPAVPAAPVVVTLPSIAGQPLVGQALTASPGTWSPASAVFAFEWQRCDPDGHGCEEVAGARNQSYTPSLGDLAHRLRVQVTASNSAGSTTVVSAPTGVVTDLPGHARHRHDHRRGQDRTTAEEMCMRGGWHRGAFRNQGECVKAAVHGGHFAVGSGDVISGPAVNSANRDEHRH